jgi:TDG/mug DNA glycosylase family protein
MMEPRVWPTLLSDPPASDGGGTSFPEPEALPVLLAREHWATRPGDLLTLDLTATRPAPVSLEDLLTGAGFSLQRPVEGLDGTRVSVRRLRTLPDTVGAGMRALVCGLNPSVIAADAGYGYAGRSNRFWTAATAADLVSRTRDPLHALLHDGVGMTDLVKRATPSAGELRRDEYREGAERVQRLVAWLRPGVVVFVGLAGWRAAVDRNAVPGWQPSAFGEVPAYVLPSTSGLNARTRLAELVEHFRAALTSAPGRRA